MGSNPTLFIGVAAEHDDLSSRHTHDVNMCMLRHVVHVSDLISRSGRSDSATEQRRVYTRQVLPAIYFQYLGNKKYHDRVL